MLPGTTQDDVIRGTNDDATVSRLSAVQLGYFTDSFVKHFVRKPVRRSPIINRGSYMRNFMLDTLIKQFLSMPGPAKQIVSLGAGFDTRYFTIMANELGTGLGSQLARYYEVDFPEITMRKAFLIDRRPVLRDALIGPVTFDKGHSEMSTEKYCLIGGDLREWKESIVPRLEHYGLDVTLPTLILSECVLIYLAQEHSDAILVWATEELSNCMFVLYEQIKPNDAFGKMMLRNLQSRDIELKGIHAYPDLKDQERRFTELGWDAATAIDINTVHDKYLDRNELARMARLEILDELEEWRLLAAHYCVAWAYKSRDAKEAFASIGKL